MKIKLCVPVRLFEVNISSMECLEHKVIGLPPGLVTKVIL